MSRSYKKPIIKDSKGSKWYNKLFRRTNKQRVNSNREPKLMKELVNDWDICDWRWFIVEKEDINKHKRK